jgi:hypothetical protein
LGNPFFPNRAANTVRSQIIFICGSNGAFD